MNIEVRIRDEHEAQAEWTVGDCPIDELEGLLTAMKSWGLATPDDTALQNLWGTFRCDRNGSVYFEVLIDRYS